MTVDGATYAFIIICLGIVAWAVLLGGSMWLWTRLRYRKPKNPAICVLCAWYVNAKQEASDSRSSHRCSHPKHSEEKGDYVSGTYTVAGYCWVHNKDGKCRKFEGVP